MLTLGLIVALNYRSSAERYSSAIDLLVPTMRWSFRRTTMTEDDRFRRLVTQNRIMAAGFSCFGLAFMVGGIISTARHLS
jgi:hypothetical protein